MSFFSLSNAIGVARDTTRLISTGLAVRDLGRSISAASEAPDVGLESGFEFGAASSSASRVDRYAMATRAFGHEGVVRRSAGGYDAYWRETMLDTVDEFVGHGGGFKPFTLAYTELAPFVMPDEYRVRYSGLLERGRRSASDQDYYRTARMRLRANLAELQYARLERRSFVDQTGRVRSGTCLVLTLQNGVVDLAKGSRGPVLRFYGHMADASVVVPEIEVMASVGTYDAPVIAPVTLYEALLWASIKPGYASGVPVTAEVFLAVE